MSKEREVSVACHVCDETGLLPPASGIAKICAHCGGRGFYVLSYVTFTGRRKREGVKMVRRSGAGILSKKARGIPYAAFLKGRFP